ncbi:hypothetical protein VIBNISOn1_790030 [Vibrio nigripulchritudo SOn1]|uniref:Uncharacterized protein n=1 Tax=Vibrio nigripulchritudo SOn1 TaxID=1238450 RepID=A0AAV2VXL1_9VIBR|nr:hypothetical protein VIBNISFn118_1050045 [Vibrio nigripulchritudo SFn118]CCO49103.1 hypothetical protein VIBNISOn1_790030 [Vibrio nigripulchritudo SOn1]
MLLTLYFFCNMDVTALVTPHMQIFPDLLLDDI